MKILICTFSYPYFHGNVFDSRFVYSEAAGYSDCGAEVTVLTPHFPGSPVLERSRKSIRIIRFPYFFPKSLQRARAPGKPLYNPGSVLALLQLPVLCLVFIARIILEARKADVIHAQWTLTALLALPAKWVTGKPLLVTARGSDIRLLPGWLNRFIFRRVDGAIDCFGPTLWNTRNKNKFPSNYLKLPHLVLDDSKKDIPGDMEYILREKPDAFIILYIGRFHPIKVTESRLPLFDLIPAVANIRYNVNFHVFYIGDGEPEVMQKLKAVIKENNQEDNISLLGPKTDVMSYMKHCDLGIGGVAFNGVSQEFTICRKPQLLIATEDNIESPWSSNVNALFCAPGELSDLTEKLEWAMNNQDKLKNFGNTAAKDMKEYFIESGEGGILYIDLFARLAHSSAD